MIRIDALDTPSCWDSRRPDDAAGPLLCLEHVLVLAQEPARAEVAHRRWSLSESLCARHNMKKRNMYAKQEEDR